jgi:hypothetical protein
MTQALLLMTKLAITGCASVGPGTRERTQGVVGIFIEVAPQSGPPTSTEERTSSFMS